MTKTSTSILIAVPCYGGWMHSYTASSLFSLGSLLREKNIPHGIITPSNESSLPHLRNHIADSFLDLGYTHLMCIDADIQFSPESVLTLLDMNVEFAAAAYRLKKEPKIELCYAPCPETTDEIITRVAHIGAGFNLIKRSVFEKMTPTATKIRGPARIWIHDFYSEYIVDGRLLIEDEAMARRWKATGGEIWMNRSVKLGHYGGHAYLMDK